MKSLIHKAAAAATAGALMTCVPYALAALPPIHRSGQIEYLSGGIGKDESAAIESASRRWPLTLEFAVKDKQRADFAADVSVVVRDENGHSALEALAGGPFLLARLAPGRYAVDATLAGKTLHERVVVQTGHPAKSVFLWPAGTDRSGS